MFERWFGGLGTAVASISAPEAAERLARKGKGVVAPVLIDVREGYEFAQGHARGARNIPLGDLGQRLSEIPRDRDVLLICQSGNRSASAARHLLRAGYTRVINISGGTSAWRMHHLPLG